MGLADDVPVQFVHLAGPRQGHAAHLADGKLRAKFCWGALPPIRFGSHIPTQLAAIVERVELRRPLAKIGLPRRRDRRRSRILHPAGIAQGRPIRPVNPQRRAHLPGIHETGLVHALPGRVIIRIPVAEGVGDDLAVVGTGWAETTFDISQESGYEVCGFWNPPVPAALESFFPSFILI